MNTNRPMNLNNQIARLYAATFLGNFALNEAVWIVMLVMRGFTLAQVGAAEGFFHLVSLLFEVPSGALADLWGRKRVLILGRLSMALAAGLMMISRSMLGVCASMAFTAIAYNLNSGTEQALTYDSLKSQGQEARYLKVNANTSLIYHIAGALSQLLAFVASAIGYVLSYLSKLVLNLLAALTLQGLCEPPASGEKRLLSDVPRMMGAHLLGCARFLRERPALFGKMMLDCAVSAMALLLTFFMQEHLMALGLPMGAIGVPLFLMGLGALAATRAAPRIAGRFAYGLLAGGSALVAGVAIALAGWTGLVGAVICAAVAGFCGGVLELVTSRRVNDEIPSEQRATLLSMGSVLFSVIMVGASPFAGWLCGAFSTSVAFSILGGALVLIAGVAGVLFRVGGRKK